MISVEKNFRVLRMLFKFFLNSEAKILLFVLLISVVGSLLGNAEYNEESHNSDALLVCCSPSTPADLDWVGEIGAIFINGLNTAHHHI